jgi:hypothetical protein
LSRETPRGKQHYPEQLHVIIEPVGYPVDALLRGLMAMTYAT